MEKFAQFYLSAVLAISSLFGCDPLSKELKRIDTEIENFQPSQDKALFKMAGLAGGLNLLLEVYPNKKDQIEKSRIKLLAHAEPMLQPATTRLQDIKKEFEIAATVHGAELEKLKPSLAKAKKRDSLQERKYKPESCIVGLNPPSEFEKDPILKFLRIYRVDQVGEDQLLVTEVYHHLTKAELDDKDLSEIKADSEYKYVVKDYAEISCAKALELRKMRAALNVKLKELSEAESNLNFIETVVRPDAELTRAYPELKK